MQMIKKKIFVISAINFFEGGPLSILNDCLDYVNKSIYINDHKFIVLVHKKEQFKKFNNENIEFLEFPKSRKSYIYRLYYEYFYFEKLAKKKNAFFWLSLHDITPNVGNINQAVYCHNPAPFNKINFSDIYIQPTQFFFTLFYRFLYQKNIKKNKFVIVQQQWIKNKFVNLFNLKKDKIIISTPQIPQIPLNFIEQKSINNNKKIFFFPTFPRSFKNIEVICEAVKLINLFSSNNFKVVITIDGSENNYSKWIYKKYKEVKNINFIGLISRYEVFKYYTLADCLVFPSKLETWGIPVSEFKQFKKHILIADLPYAKETIGDYSFVNFFNPNSAKQLSELMHKFIKNETVNDVQYKTIYEYPTTNSWEGLFSLLLKDGL